MSIFAGEYHKKENNVALSKKISLTNGVTANYHNVTILKDAPARRTQYQVCSYINKKARDGGKVPVMLWPLCALPAEAYHGEVESDIYNYLKTTPQFEGATDV